MRGIRFGVVQSAVAQALTPLGWGEANYGMLGNGTGTSAAGFQTVLLTGALEGKTIAQVASGLDHSLFLATDGTLAAVGRGVEFQLGDGLGTNSTIPVLVDRSEASALWGKTVVGIACGGGGGAGVSYALCSDGTVAGWGSNAGWQVPGDASIPRSMMTGSLEGQFVTQVAAGEGLTGFLTASGTVHVRAGAPLYLGNPAEIAGGALTGKLAKQLSAGASRLLILCTDGSVAGIGNNGYGALGDGTQTKRTVPVSLIQTGVLAGKTISQLATGYYASWALCSDGFLAGWGFGEIGDNQSEARTEPVAVTGHGALTEGIKPVAIRAGFRSCWLRTAAGALLGCGENSAYQLVANQTNTREFVQIGLPANAVFLKFGNDGGGLAKSCHAFFKYNA